jgi:hypothetical protein
MNKRYTLIVLLVLWASLTPLAQAQTPRYAPAPPEVLQDVLKRNPPHPDLKPRYSCAWLDLNADGVPEAILWSPGGDNRNRLFDGGNRYDGFVVYQKTGKSYRFLGSGLYGRDVDQIGVLKTHTGKWLDLACYKFSFGDEKNPRDNYWYRCRNRGQGYSTDTTLLKAAPKMLLLNRASAPAYPLP